MQKQSGGRGQYGHCKVKFEPMDANGEETFKFESAVVGGAIPKEYIPQSAKVSRKLHRQVSLQDSRCLA